MAATTQPRRTAVVIGASMAGLSAAAVLASRFASVVIVEREEGLYEPRDVKIGRSSGGYTELLSGIEAGERIVVAPIDISALRHEREVRRGHHMLAHLRTEAYPVYQQHQYPPEQKVPLSYENNNRLIDEAKQRLKI